MGRNPRTLLPKMWMGISASLGSLRTCGSAPASMLSSLSGTSRLSSALLGAGSLASFGLESLIRHLITLDRDEKGWFWPGGCHVSSHAARSMHFHSTASPLLFPSDLSSGCVRTIKK